MKILEIIFNYTHTHIYIFSTYIYQVPSMLGTMKNTKLIKAMVVTFVGIKF